MSRASPPGTDERLTVGLLAQGWWPQPGGIEAHTRALARGLGARGHRVTARCQARGGGGDPYAVEVREPDGVELWRMRARVDLRALADRLVDPGAEAVVRGWSE